MAETSAIAKPGPMPYAPRDGDKEQARQRINVEVRTGYRPHPNTLPCIDCGHVWKEGERRHEYDHQPSVFGLKDSGNASTIRGGRMAETTNISWCDSTMNPWIGCQKVSCGCDNCYAETLMDTRYGRVEWGQRKTEETKPSVGTRSRTSPAYWRQPIKWNKNAAAFQKQHGHRQRVFCASLADVFDNQVDVRWRVDLWKLIWDTPNLDWLLLTKRPENIEDMLPESWRSHADEWSHVWLGTTAENQEYFDRRWPILRRIPARVRFISYEPAIGPLQLFGDAPYPDWFIAGGESGKNFRSVNSDCFRQVKHGCEYHGIPFFMKQMPGLVSIPDDLMLRQFPRSA